MRFSTEQIITIVLSLLSLGITVVGWGFTAVMQLIILGAQIQERKQIEARQILFNQRLEQLGELRKWFQDGEKNLRSRIITGNEKGGFDKIKAQLIEWKRLYGKAKVIALMIDTAYPTHDNVSQPDYYWAVFLNMIKDKKVDVPRDNILSSYVDEFYKLVTIDFSSVRDTQAVTILEKQLNEIYSKGMMKLDEITITKLPITESSSQ